MREDYSEYGTAWDYFPHDLARSKAYRWGEDGLAGICDRYQILTFGLALWNGHDSILKERLYGLVPSEANHGEDVKEYYFYLDSTPTPVHDICTAYPRGGFSRKLIENRRGVQRLPNMSCWTPAYLTTIAISTCSSNMPNRPQRHLYSHRVCNRGPEDAIHILPKSGFASLGLDREQDLSRQFILVSSKTYQSLEGDDSQTVPLHNHLSVPNGQTLSLRRDGKRALITNNRQTAARWGLQAKAAAPTSKMPSSFRDQRGALIQQRQEPKRVSPANVTSRLDDQSFVCDWRTRFKATLRHRKDRQ